MFRPIFASLILALLTISSSCTQRDAKGQTQILAVATPTNIPYSKICQNVTDDGRKSSCIRMTILQIKTFSMNRVKIKNEDPKKVHSFLNIVLGRAHIIGDPEFSSLLPTVNSSVDPNLPSSDQPFIAIQSQVDLLEAIALEKSLTNPNYFGLAMDLLINAKSSLKAESQIPQCCPTVNCSGMKYCSGCDCVPITY